MPLFQKFFNSNLFYFFQATFIVSLLGIILLIVDFGFPQSGMFQRYLNSYYFVVLILGIVATVLRYLVHHKSFKRSVILFDVLSIGFTISVIVFHFFGEEMQRHVSYLYNDNWVKFAIILTFIREFSEQNINYKRTVLNPAQLFILSFLSIILVGSLLLMLPEATYNGLTFIDALFTATSAVCVTGLIVVDTATHFTLFGQTIIIGLIQVGGLGILTFASYFSYFFKGGTSYENQLTISDMSGSNKLGEAFSTLKHVILITFTIELITAFFIFLSLDNSLFNSFFERLYFSVFHAISAFCNAGFSTLSNGLYDINYRYNYFLQIMIIFGIVMGGLGFPIVVNLLKYTKYIIKRKLLFFYHTDQIHRPWVLNINSRITIITTAILLVGGTLLFYILEYNNTLVEHSGFGKVVTALFGATTPRTAGYNTVDMAALDFTTLLLTIFLMWVGASPASTGGGIKTTTFAIATLNIFSLAKGKTRLEIFRREISQITIHRAFAAIALSLMTIGIGITLISIFDSDQSLINIAVECFSAYCTVGLSVGITAKLTAFSKLVLIVLMFVGRVSMLTVMIAIIKKVKQQNYRYPIEDITIN